MDATNDERHHNHSDCSHAECDQDEPSNALPLSPHDRQPATAEVSFDAAHRSGLKILPSIVAHASASRAKSRVVCHSWHYYHRNVSTCGLHEQPRAPTRARTAWCVPQPDDGTKPASCDVTVVDYRSNSAEGGSAPLGFVRVLQHALTLGDDVGSVVPSVRLPVHVAFQVLVRVHTLLVHQTRKHTFSTRNDAHRGITNRTLCQARVVP